VAINNWIEQFRDYIINAVQSINIGIDGKAQ